ASGTAHGNGGEELPWRLRDGSRLSAWVRLNRKEAPAGTEVHGVLFQSLGTYRISHGRLRVVLANDAADHVVAGAIHVARKPVWGPVVLQVGQLGYEESGQRWAA